MLNIQRVLLFVAIAVMVDLSLAAANYGQSYQVSSVSRSFQYSAFSTSTTTVEFGLPLTNTNGSFSVTTFSQTQSVIMSSYSYPGSSNLILYGVYRVNILGWENGSNSSKTPINLYSTNIGGIYNVDPNSMRIFILNNASNAWLKAGNSGSYVNGATTTAYSIATVEDLIATAVNKSNVGFTFAVYGAAAQAGQSSFQTNVNINGPGSVVFSLNYNLIQQLTLSFTNQPVGSTASFYLNKDNYIVNNYGLSAGYITLYSFYYGTQTMKPSVSGQTWTFSFNSQYGFRDGNGNTVQIDPTTITCAYRSSLSSSYYTQSGIVSYNQVSCPGGNYPYVAIVAKSLATPSASPSPSLPSSITTLYSYDTENAYVYSSGKNYYKIDVPSGQYLTLYYSMSSSSYYNPYIYIGSGYVPSSSNYDYSDFLVTTNDYKAIYNSYYTTKTYYILVKGSYSSGAYYTLTAYVGDSPHYPYSSGWNYVVASAVAGSLGFGFCLLSAIVVFVVIRKNRNANYSRV